MPVRARAKRLKQLIDRAQLGAGQHGADRFDLFVRQRREVGQRAFADLLAFAVRLAQQIRRAGSAVWHSIDMHGYSVPNVSPQCKSSAPITWLHMRARKPIPHDQTVSATTA